MRRVVGLFVAVVVAAPACQSSKAPTPAPPPASSSAERERTVSEAEAQQWLEGYFANEVEMPTDDPTVVFVAGELDVPCKPLPSVRPQDFEVNYWHRGGEPRSDDPQYGVAAEVCHFEWRLLHLDERPSHCAPLGGEGLDALYAQLRALKVSSIRVRTNDDPSPDRGGYGLSLRWPGARCEILDMVGSEVVEESVPAFTGALDAFRKAYDDGLRAGRKRPAGPTSPSR